MKKFKKILIVFTLAFMASVIGVLLVSCSAKSATYTFNTNGGDEISKVEVGIGEEFELPTPNKDGYSFEGWYLTEDFSGDAVTEVVAESSQTFYAKWEKLYAVSLNLDGGTLSVSTLYLKAGENIYNAVQNYTPTKPGYQFGAWFNGESELAKNAKMTEANVTLTAKYKIAYNVELWLQNEDLTTYEKSNVITYYEYVGTKVVAAETLTGYTEVTNENCVLTKTLTDNASDNVLVQYFDREKYNVTFNSNYPDGTYTTQMVPVTYGFGVEVPSDLTYEGYCLIGWSTSANGSVECKANYLESVLYGNEEIPEAAKYFPTRNTTLYAVWAKGYSDMFGNSDYLFLLDETSDVIYLSRGGVFFEGSYDADEQDFYFILGNGDILEGKFISNGTYVYYDTGRMDKVYSLLSDDSVDESIKIYFDQYNGIKYVAEDTSEGTFYIDEKGFYVATFTTGKLENQTLTFIVGTITISGISTPVFQVRNDAELELGELARYAVYDGVPNFYYPIVAFDGFEFALYNTNDATYYLYYNMDSEMETFILYDENNTIILTGRIFEINGVKCYALYNEKLDQSYQLSNGDELILDGMYSATYIKEGVTISGYFSETGLSSAFGGEIIDFVSTNYECSFIVGADEDGNYVAQEKNIGYAEYHYYNATLSSSSTYKYHYAPLLVVEEPTSGTIPGTMVMYGFSTTGTYEKVSKGSYVYDSASGTYVYTAEEHFDAVDIYDTPEDLNKVQSIVFVLDSKATNYSINYWYSSTDKEGNVTDYEVINYTPANGGGATLTLVAGLAIYSVDGNVHSGKYTIDDDGTMVITTTSGKVYIDVDLENKTFVAFEYAPYNAYVLTEDGYYSRNEYFAFDGKGGVVYTIITPAEEEGEEDNKVTYSGTIVKTDKVTDFGFYVYSFTCEGKTFEYVQFSTESVNLVSLYNESINGTYNSEDGILKLDGFGLYAIFIDSNGDEYTGMYSIYSENVVRIIIDDYYRYFDILEDREFTLRGIEYGTYILIDNQNLNGIYLEFDGYGKMKVFTVNVSGNESKINYIDEEGAYSIEGNVFTLTYADGANNVTLIGERSTYAYDSLVYNTFIVSHKEIIKTFVNEKDWSVLILDDIGNAVKYDSVGNKETGNYTIITENLLYYVNESATDACIYLYNLENGTATPNKFTPRGYYTQDLESLIFEEYGFAVFNGTERLYYNEVNGEIVIYKYDPTNDLANEYGYVEDKSFGKLENEEVYEGKTYYKNGGFELTFARDEDGKDDYKVSINGQYYPVEDLIFQPSGSTEFTCVGQVTINGKSYLCNVIRAINDSDEVETYILIASVLGYLRLDIEISYVGSKDNSYKVVGMSNIIYAPSYTYLDVYYTYYLLDSIFGTNLSSNYKNSIGVVTITTEYNAEGEETTSYISAAFGEGSGMYLDGELINLEKVSYETEDGIYVVELDDKDGNTYKLYLTFEYYSAFSTFGFYFMFTRAESVSTTETSPAYTVNVERVIVSDIASAGSISKIELLKEGVAIEPSIIWTNEDLIYIVERTTNDSEETLTTYYVIELIEEDSSLEVQENAGIPLYESVKVTSETVSTIYTSDGESFVDISDENGVLFISLNKDLYIVVNCSYDQDTNTYTVVTDAGKSFAVKVESDNTVVITEVEEDNSEEI